MGEKTREDTKVFSPSMSLIIKGVAILWMVIHHMYGFPDWHEAGVYEDLMILGKPLSYWVCDSLKVCVGMFAFITGYGYFYAKEKTFRYSLKKILGVYLRYWFLSFCLFYPLAKYFWPGYEMRGIGIFYHLTALNGTLMNFMWYLPFYAYTMMMLWICHRFWHKNIWIHLSGLILVSSGLNFLLRIVVKVIPPIYHLYLVNFSEWIYWFPVAALGYFLAKADAFSFLSQYWKWKHPLVSVFIILGLLLLRIQIESIAGITLDLIYVPGILGELLYLHRRGHLEYLGRVLTVLGRYSLDIWFFHALLFSPYTSYIQKYIFLVTCPIVEIGGVLILCLLLSMAMEWGITHLKKFLMNCIGEST